jgi:hypothetical protein
MTKDPPKKPTVSIATESRPNLEEANISTTMNVYGGAFMEAKRKANSSVVQRVLLQDRTK